MNSSLTAKESIVKSCREKSVNILDLKLTPDHIITMFDDTLGMRRGKATNKLLGSLGVHYHCCSTVHFGQFGHFKIPSI